jgi:hypothetical protein
MRVYLACRECTELGMQSELPRTSTVLMRRFRSASRVAASWKLHYVDGMMGGWMVFIPSGACVASPVRHRSIREQTFLTPSA